MIIQMKSRLNFKLMWEFTDREMFDTLFYNLINKINFK